MLRRPLVLAALADAAVPGLRPIEVEGQPVRSGAPYQCVDVTGEDGKRWTVRASLTTAAGAAVDSSSALARLLRPRLEVALPEVAGVARTSDDSIVAVYPQLPGQTLSFRDLQARSPLARSLGTVIAQLHDLDPAVYDEAGLPTYDAEAVRARRLGDLDRAAATGHVPTGLLARWERAMEGVTLWHFPTVPTHGTLDETDVLVDGEQVTALDGWQSAAVSDPAADFALLFLGAAPDAFDTVVESYAQARRERPDQHLERRIRLAAELRLMADLMDARAVGDEHLVARCTRALRRLDEQTALDDSLTPPPPGRRPAPAAVSEEVDPDDIESVDEHPSTDDEETLEIPVAGPDGRPAGAASEEGDEGGTVAADDTGDQESVEARQSDASADDVTSVGHGDDDVVADEDIATDDNRDDASTGGGTGTGTDGPQAADHR
ncbi:phosphotransferase [Barrientosiimonas humi]|uniref:phosphotransferase n=1 Tax=Barrientosiimonas humi TaxID=999931 RepID=UPI00370D5EA2